PVGPVAAFAPSTSVTLVEGQTFCVCADSGDIVAGRAQGLFLLDTRVLSRWQLRVNGNSVETLAVDRPQPFSASFVGRSRHTEGRVEPELVVHRRRDISQGMRERVTIVNHGMDDATC